MIAGLVLAAGAGTRLGRPKAEVLLGGRRLLDRAIELLHAGGCEDVIAVVRTDSISADNARLIVNPDADSGMASSLRAGLAALHPDTEAVLITLVDLPGVRPAEIRSALGWYRNGASIIVTRRAGQRSHPVLISRRWLRLFTESAQGDQGGRTFFHQHFEDIDFLDYPDELRDIDTPEDLAAAELSLAEPAPPARPAP
jgi:CTP:molybdopterin cytidylyltransferase MocA